MNIQAGSLLFTIALLLTTAATAPAQTSDRGQSNTNPAQEGTSLPANANSIDNVANEIALLRKSVQTVNTRLREITETLLTNEGRDKESTTSPKSTISANLELLARAEERAEVLRKQLIDLTEKEISYKGRMMQDDEDMRPENIERALAGIGTTRTPELRETRRRSLENDRRGLDTLLSLTTQGRLRLEEDVRQADALVAKLRQRLLPLIEKEIDKLPYP